MSASKAKAYPHEAPFRCFTLGQAPGPTHKHFTRLERPARDKHSKLLQTFVNYYRKTFCILGTGEDRGLLISLLKGLIFNLLEASSLMGIHLPLLTTNYNSQKNLPETNALA